MKKFMRRIAVVVGAAAVSAGLLGGTAAPAHAAGGTSPMRMDSSWSH